MAAHSNKQKKVQKTDTGWPFKVFILTVILSLFMSFFSQTTLLGVPIAVAVLILAVIILTGILFDIIGVAVAAQNTSDFAAMASRKIKGAKRAIRLVQQADRVASVCNDVVGDICGIVSGAMGAVIASRLLTDAFTGGRVASILVSCSLSALIAAATVSGKAVGKRYALSHSRNIVYAVARVLSIFDKA